MESLQASINASVQKVKEEVFLAMDDDPYSLIASSAYNTAWLAMVPADNGDPLQPMFKNCLDWVLNNQKEDGFWGECDSHGMPTVECLPATIACMVALQRWNAGQLLIDRGIAFIEANAEKLITREIHEWCPRWLAIILPAMLELAHANGLEISFPDNLQGAVMDILYRRQEILDREKLVDKCSYPPLLTYLEALPLHNIDQEHVAKHLSNNGSLFDSPSATACAFMATGNKDCLRYLQTLVEKCPHGVPPTYPMDEELIKLCMVNQLQRLGLAEHFKQEIEEVLEHVYRNYMNRESNAKSNNLVVLASKLYRDSLAFWLLRMHGYNVSPWMFCWFLLDEEIQAHIQNNQEFFSSVMLNVHRATDLMFPGEYELEEAKSFSRNLLEKCITKDQKDFPFPNFQTMIKQELRFPWLARLEHLDHRMWIEEKNINALWMEKASFIRFSSLYNDKLIQLAIKNYELRQSIYKQELEELKRWSKSWGLTDMGFAREKTTYCYFGVAASTSLPLDSDLRMIIAKSGIIITVADDFYDAEGSIDELEKLTDAVRRWDAKGLKGHSKIIFDVLDDLVREMAAKYLQQVGNDDITASLQYIWYETFDAWFMEAKWSRSGFIPSADDYLETGMTSIATHIVVLSASYFLNTSLPTHKLKPPQYEAITKLLMIIPRLLNDLQSYEKEQKEGKINFVLLNLEKNPGLELEDSIAITKKMLEEKRREFIQEALMDGFNELPKQIRQLHLSCLKVFEMFFYSTNRYDSNTEMIQDIQKAIYLPLVVTEPKPLNLPETPIIRPLLPPAPLLSRPTRKRYQTLVNYHFDQRFKHYRSSISRQHIDWPLPKYQSMNRPMPLNFKFCFI
ncbi:hypothetical protein MANES_17G041800v8 [Manihot esculenta]|uniref:Uncharacterized protein n=1 Tax=Manihot esculenta TaxID=3983 RepID=A0ACB7G2H6_MANES|nr:hypothetical protein MANES_17G041800v8 [Manihot esculenta]